MAFRILSPEEVELLTEAQRKVYDEELDVYLERIRFVEQMEKFENAVIEPYVPKLEKLPPVRLAPEKEYLRPVCNADVEPAVPCSVPDVWEIVAVDVPSNIHLPIYEGMSIPEGNYHKPTETHIPSLPELSKVPVPSKVLKDRPPFEPQLPNTEVSLAPEITLGTVPPVRADLPEHVGAAVPATKAFTPITVDREAIEKAAPAVVTQAPQVTYQGPEVQMAALPEIQLKMPVEKKIVFPELQHGVPPEVFTPSEVNVSFTPPMTQMEELPDTVKPVARIPAFQQLEMDAPAEFVFTSPVVPVKEFDEIRVEMKDLPQCVTPQMPQSQYKAPQTVQTPDLTEFTKPLAIPDIDADAVLSPVHIREIT